MNSNSNHFIISKRSSFALYFFSFLLLIVFFSFFPMNQDTVVKAAEKKSEYGIMIGNSSGKYTYYDYNNVDTPAKMEVSSNKKAMLPVWYFTKESDILTYYYNKATKTLILKNTYNNKSLQIIKGSSSCTYYPGKNKNGIEKQMPSPLYISKSSNAIMVPASILSLLMDSGGYQYFNTSALQQHGYDTTTNTGMFVYNPYSKVGTLPNASSVIGIPSTVRVTIPEGYAVAQVFDLLVKKGVCSSTDALYHALNTYDFSYYPLVAQLPTNENRCFRLEGYLFPDTYEFYRLMSGEDVIGKFIRNVEQKLTEDRKEKAANLGFSVDEILTIASIIEKETGDHSQMPIIASLLYNRLEKGMRLELDASTYYVERYIKPYISGDINRYNSFYNTYKCSALPAGPICNPGLASIEAALNPAQTDYLFFCSDQNGNYYYSSTYKEHLERLDLLRKEGLLEESDVIK